MAVTWPPQQVAAKPKINMYVICTPSVNFSACENALRQLQRAQTTHWWTLGGPPTTLQVVPGGYHSEWMSIAHTLGQRAPSCCFTIVGCRRWTHIHMAPSVLLCLLLVSLLLHHAIKFDARPFYGHGRYSGQMLPQVSGRLSSLGLRGFSTHTCTKCSARCFALVLELRLLRLLLLTALRGCENSVRV